MQFTRPVQFDAGPNMYEPAKIDEYWLKIFSNFIESLLNVKNTNLLFLSIMWDETTELTKLQKI